MKKSQRRMFGDLFLIVALALFQVLSSDLAVCQTKISPARQTNSAKQPAKTTGGDGVVSRYITGLQKGDLRTIVDLSYSYQRELKAIKAANPEVLWPKLTKDFYDGKVANLTSNPSSMGSYLQGFSPDPAQQIRLMQGLLLPDATWKVTESRSDQVQDSFSGEVWDRTTVYVTVDYSSLVNSPFVDGKFLKATILEFDLNTKLQQVMNLGRLPQGDTPLEAPVTIMNAKLQREGMLGRGGLVSEAFGGKPPYTWRSVCGSYDLSSKIANRPNQPQRGSSILVDLEQFPKSATFPMRCTFAVTDGGGQRDTMSISVKQMLTGFNEFCYVREPWLKRGQGKPSQSNMCLEPFLPVDAATSDVEAAEPSPSSQGVGTQSASSQSNASGSMTSESPTSPECRVYSDCLKAALKHYNASDLVTSLTDFQAAADADPRQGQPWYWQGVVMLKAHQITQVGQLARLWDKAIALGSLVAIAACHERGLQPCERGDLLLSSKSVSFSRGNTRDFDLPPQQIEPGQILNNASFAHVAYRFKANGKSYTLDFAPSTWPTCKFQLTVQCPRDGYSEQVLLTQYVAQALPKLASGALNADMTSRTSSTQPDVTARSVPNTAPPFSSAGPQSDSTAGTVVIQTDSGQVRVHDFHARVKGTDEFGNEFLEKNPKYEIAYGANTFCFYNSKQKGCFSIKVTEQAGGADEVAAQKLLMGMLGISLRDFCRLPISVSTLEDKVTNQWLSTPPGLCPNGLFHYTQ